MLISKSQWRGTNVKTPAGLANWTHTYLLSTEREPMPTRGSRRLSFGGRGPPWRSVWWRLSTCWGHNRWQLQMSRTTALSDDHHWSVHLQRAREKGISGLLKKKALQDFFFLLYYPHNTKKIVCSSQQCLLYVLGSLQTFSVSREKTNGNISKSKIKSCRRWWICYGEAR